MIRVMHLTTQGTPHRVRCGAEGWHRLVGSWPSHVPGRPAEPPFMPKWLREDGWRWCKNCVRLDARDRR